MAILQFFSGKPPEEQVYRCMKALAKFCQGRTGSEVEFVCFDFKFEQDYIKFDQFRGFEIILDTFA